MKCTVIGIAGGTGSGKSTFTARVKAAFPDKVAVLYHDNYYKARDNIPFEERKTINYDHPNSLETDLLIEHVKSLKNDKSVDAPTYDFTQHTRAEATLHIEPKPVIIIEGILTLQNVELVNLMDIKIFVEADADERILRRAIRDVKERGRDLEGVAEQYLQTVKPMHYLYVEPKNVADIVINSGMYDVAFWFFLFFRKTRSFFQQTVPGFPGTNAFVWVMDSPSMSQRNSCRVSFFRSLSLRGHWNRFSVRRLYSRMYPVPSQYNALIRSARLPQNRYSDVSSIS